MPAFGVSRRLWFDKLTERLREERERVIP
jgi:hypothetical protein